MSTGTTRTSDPAAVSPGRPNGLLKGWEEIARYAGYRTGEELKFAMRSDPRWEAIIHVRPNGGVGKHKRVFSYEREVHELMKSTPTLAELKSARTPEAAQS